MNTKGKVFILESPNALDLLEERGERYSLEKVCKIFGHDATSFLLRDSAELKQTLMYIGAILRHPSVGDSPLFIHISAHGDSNGIAVGPDDVSWNKLAAMISKTYDYLDKYRGAIILIVSACHANEQELTKLIKKKYEKKEIRNPPDYIFVFSNEDVDWRDAVVTWTMFYRMAGNLEFLSDERKNIREIQKLLNRFGKTKFGSLTYFRWDVTDKAYKKFSG